MKLRFRVASVIVLALTVSGCDSPAPTEPPANAIPALTATPKKATPITAVVDLSGPLPGLPNIINPECIAVDAGKGIADFKDCIVLGTLTGDLTGDVTAELNGRQDLATLTAKAHGHFTMDTCHPVLGCGAFTGPFKSTAIPGGQATLTGNGHGTGDFHTLQLRLTALERGNTSVYDLTGVIF